MTWQRQPELQPGEVFVLDITKNELEKIRFDDEDAKTWAELQPGSDENGSFVALRLSAREAPAKQDNHACADAKAHPGTSGTRQRRSQDTLRALRAPAGHPRTRRAGRRPS
jgi:hypothetical protein